MVRAVVAYGILVEFHMRCVRNERRTGRFGPWGFWGICEVGRGGCERAQNYLGWLVYRHHDGVGAGGLCFVEMRD